MIAPQFRLKITSYYEDVKKLKQKLMSKYKISLFLIKKLNLVDELSSTSSKENKYFIYNWKILEKFQEETEYLFRIELKVFSKRSGKKINLKFLIYEKLNDFLMAISNLNSVSQRRIKQFINTYYPFVSNFYLIHDEILSVIEELESKFLYPFASRWHIISEKFGKKADKDIRYRRGLYYKKCFVKARKENKFVEKIQLDNLKSFFKFSNGQPYDFKITRKGEISISRGKFDKFFLFLIDKIISVANGKYLLLKDRSRETTPNNEINPVIIEFFSSPFKEKEGIDALIKILREYINCSYAIIHAGNPYLEIIFVDYEDNSSFSLVTFSNKSIIIYPQLYASGAALLKLFDYITERYSDGILYDYEDYKRNILIELQ